MKLISTLIISSLFVVISPLFAAESASEKASATAADAGRAMKKTGHRVTEAMCMEGDVKCAARKAKHRGTETKDVIGDKAKEVGNKIDSNSSPSH